MYTRERCHCLLQTSKLIYKCAIVQYESQTPYRRLFSVCNKRSVNLHFSFGPFFWVVCTYITMLSLDSMSLRTVSSAERTNTSLTLFMFGSCFSALYKDEYAYSLSSSFATSSLWTYICRLAPELPLLDKDMALLSKTTDTSFSWLYTGTFDVFRILRGVVAFPFVGGVPGRD
jgi:hypothetical protein